MVDKFSNFVVLRLIKNDLIIEEDAEIYAFGLRQSLKYLVFLLICSLIGIMMHNFVGTIFFLFCFVPLRNMTGGFHLQDEFSCFLLSVFTVGIYSFVQSFLMTSNTWRIALLILLLAIFQLILPLVDHTNKPIDDTDFKIFQSFKFKVVIIEVAIGLIASKLQFELMSSTILVVLGFNSVSNLLGLIHKRSLRRHPN